MWEARKVLSRMPVFGSMLGLVVACQVSKQEQPYHTPGPPRTVTNPASPDHRDSVLAYAHRLRYDSLTHGAADRQRLAYFDSAAGYRLGPLATIYPEAGANQNADSALAGAGRIIGRIESDSAYGKLGLSKGVNYVWVDSLKTWGDTGIGRAIIVPEEEGVRPVVLPLFYMRNRGYSGTRGPALARWLFRPQDDAAWLTCKEGGCCAVGVSSSAGINITTGLY